MADLIERITEKVQSFLPDDAHFIVQISLKSLAGRQRLQILLDADNGLDIDTCASVSRQLAAWFDETNLIPQAFTLEVSSPGLDFSLNTERLYKKNLGRELKVVTTTGETVRGMLQEVNAEGFSISPMQKKKPKKGEASIAARFINYSEVKKALVQVSFGALED